MGVVGVESGSVGFGGARFDGVERSFRVSSFCSHGTCVEVGFRPDGAAVVRDAKDPARSLALVFSPAEWSSFVNDAKAGLYDRP